MSHDEKKERVLELGDEPLTAQEREAAESHLALCEECRNDALLWKSLRKKIAAVKTAGSDDFVQSVMGLVRKEPVPGLRGALAGLWHRLQPAASLRWAAAGLGTLALAALLYCPRSMSTTSVSLAALSADYPYPFEDEAGSLGTDLEDYLL